MESRQPGTPHAAPPLSEATFAGGCFWCIEAVFLGLRGVETVESGYSNGHDPAPTYEAVCSGETGHAEVVRVRFNPIEISYHQLLEVFFAVHDPTTLNRQGNDVGTQYRSGIYTHDAQQAQTARDFIEQLAMSGIYERPIVTEVAPLANYHPAEPYHQRYFEHHPHQGYCAFVVAPKVDKSRRLFPDLLRQA